MTRLDRIRVASRKRDRRNGKPVNLPQAEVVAIRRELADGIASGQDVETLLTSIAERHGVTPHKVRFCGMAMFCGRPPLLTYAAEIKNGRAGMSERHRTHVKGWSE